MGDDTKHHMAPPRPLPSLATVQATVEVLVGQIKGLRLDVERLGKIITDPAPDVMRFAKLPTIASLAPPAIPAESRPSMAAKAAQGGSKLGAIIMIGTGVLSVAGQVVAVWKPEYTGPIVQALRLLASLGGSDP